MAHLIALPGSEPVNEGERRVVAALVTELPDSYSVIPNVEIASCSCASIQKPWPSLHYLSPHLLIPGSTSIQVVKLDGVTGSYFQMFA